MPALVWFRLDLRLADNPALHAAIQHNGPVVPVFIHAPEEEKPWAPGAASNWWLHHSLKALGASLRKTGSRLVIRRGPTLETLRALARETDADAVFWNRRYEPAVIARDQEIKQALRSSGCIAKSFNTALLKEPGTVCRESGKPFQVFTPFWRNCLMDLEPPEPLPRPSSLYPPSRWPRSLPLDELELQPRIDWTEGIAAAWWPGEAGAHERLKEFVASAFRDYERKRNHPGVAGTSRLSPHLHFGEIGPSQMWHSIRRAAESAGFRLWRSSQFLTELGWREFSHHLLHHFPDTPENPLREEFQHFTWRTDAEKFKAWQKGETGYPIVDAGMRELWATGWMHNRVRMLAASFLVKDLLLDWRSGARWFWDTLVDADLAQNTMGWQWTAGCGADAAPYFRVFNPQIQGRKFDEHGAYVRRWCPELAKLPDEWVHQPADAPAQVLSAAGIALGRTYPKPIVDHSLARSAALEVFAMARGLYITAPDKQPFSARLKTAY